MNLRQIKETCIYYRDLELAKQFYHERLGLPIITYEKGKHLFLRAGTSVLLCFNPDDSMQKKTPPAHYTEGKCHFAFEVSREEYQKHKEELVAKGIIITQQITWKNGQESFYFEDPIGNVLEIVPEGIWE